MEILETNLDAHPDCAGGGEPFEPPSKHLETNLGAHPDCADLLKDTPFEPPSKQTSSSSRLLRVPNFVSQAVADIVTAPLHRVKYARGLLVYLNVFWSTGTCYRLRGCCACISATAPRLADSFRNSFRSAWSAIFRISGTQSLSSSCRACHQMDQWPRFSSCAVLVFMAVRGPPTASALAKGLRCSTTF